MTYEAWRVSYQSSEQAARAAYEEAVQLDNSNTELAAEIQMLREQIERAAIACAHLEAQTARTILLDALKTPNA